MNPQSRKYKTDSESTNTHSISNKPESTNTPSILDKPESIITK